MKTNTLKILTALLCTVILLLPLVSCGKDASTTRGEEFKMIQGVDALNLSDTKGDRVIVSFPGLGLEPVVINKVAFNIGSVSIGWSFLLLLAVIAVAFAYAYLKSRQEKIKLGELFSIGALGIVGGVVGSRLYYVMMSPVSFKGRTADIFKIWDGGHAVYGAIIGGALAIALVCKLKKLKILKAYDMAASAFMIGQIIGRWGDLINVSSYGYEIKAESAFYWLRMGIYPHINSAITATDNHFAYVHPVFLYESVWNLLGFIIINIFYTKKKKFDGQIFFMYIAWYGLGRTFTELLRTDSLYIFGTIRVSLLIGCLSFFAGVALLVYGAIQGKKQKLAADEYESAYPLFGTKFTRKNSNNSQKEEDGNNETD